MRKLKSVAKLLLLTFIVTIYFTRRQIGEYVITVNGQRIPEEHRSIIRESASEKLLRNPSPEPLNHTEPSPTPTSSQNPKTKTPSPTNNPELDLNYQLEPCENDDEVGCYMIRNAPSETMSTVDDLNLAVNAYRSNHNLSQMFIDQQLCEVADIRAKEVEEEFSHAKFGEHVENGDFDYIGFHTIAENLWQGSFSAVHIVEFGWDKSDGHRANLQGSWNRGCAGIHGINAVFIFVN